MEIFFVFTILRFATPAESNPHYWT